MSDTHRDLGYIPDKPDKGSLVWNASLEDRRRNAFQALGIDDRGQRELVLRVLGRELIYWPSSDTWYSKKKGTFGYGIKKVLDIAKSKPEVL